MKNRVKNMINPNPVEKIPNVNPKIAPEEDRSLFNPWLI